MLAGSRPEGESLAGHGMPLGGWGCGNIKRRHWKPRAGRQWLPIHCITRPHETTASLLIPKQRSLLSVFSIPTWEFSVAYSLTPNLLFTRSNSCCDSASTNVCMRAPTTVSEMWVGEGGWVTKSMQLEAGRHRVHVKMSKSSPTGILRGHAPGRNPRCRFSEDVLALEIAGMLAACSEPVLSVPEPLPMPWEACRPKILIYLDTHTRVSLLDWQFLVQSLCDTSSRNDMTSLAMRKLGCKRSPFSCSSLL